MYPNWNTQAQKKTKQNTKKSKKACQKIGQEDLNGPQDFWEDILLYIKTKVAIFGRLYRKRTSNSSVRSSHIQMV